MEDLSWTSFEAYSPEYVEKFISKLRELESSKGSELSFEDLNNYDLLHPGKHAGIDSFCSEFNISQGSKVLEIGIGLGGTSRYLYYTRGVEIYGFDYLQHLVDGSNEANKALQISEGITHVQGDVCTIELPKGMDCAISIGVFVHVDSEAGFFNVAGALKPNGLLYLEEYYFKKEREDFDANDRQLIEDRFLIGVKTKNELLDILQRAGFEVLSQEEFGTNWSEAAWNRANDLVKAQNDGRITPNPGIFHQCVQVSTQLTSELEHLTQRELLKRYAELNTVFDVVERVNKQPKLTGIIKLIAKKVK